MSSIISIGVSFLLFFVVLGFMWLIGVHLLSELFETIDNRVSAARGVDPSWVTTKDSIKSQIQLVMVWAPAILVLFGCIKLLAGAGGQGRE